MTNQGYALSRAELIRALTAYSGITTDDGAADGTTLVDSNLIDNAHIAPASIPEKTIFIYNGDARGEDKGSASFNNVTGTITLQGTGFAAQIKAGTIYRILNISSVEIDVATINTKLGTNVDLPGTTTVFAYLALLLVSGGATFAIVNALLMLTETGGTISTDGTEQTIYVNDAPAGVFSPKLIKLDFTNQTAAEVVVVRVKDRIKSGGTPRVPSEVTFNGVQDPVLKYIDLRENRFGIEVTMERVAGNSKDYDFEVFYKV